jgi:hypothetical protein
MFQQDENGRGALVEHTLTDAQQAYRDALRAELAEYLAARTARAMLDLRAAGLPTHGVLTLVSDVLTDVHENGYIMVEDDE